MKLKTRVIPPSVILAYPRSARIARPPLQLAKPPAIPPAKPPAKGRAIPPAKLTAEERARLQRVQQAIREAERQGLSVKPFEIRRAVREGRELPSVLIPILAKQASLARPPGITYREWRRQKKLTRKMRRRLAKVPPPWQRPTTLATVAGIFSLVLPTASLIGLHADNGSLIPTAYTLIISGVTFMSYGYDKMQAEKLGWRVKARTLHTLELLGGWPGALAGQHYFGHKMLKKKFIIPFWAIVLGWQAVWLMVWNRDGTALYDAMHL